MVPGQVTKDATCGNVQIQLKHAHMFSFWGTFIGTKNWINSKSQFYVGRKRCCENDCQHFSFQTLMGTSSLKVTRLSVFATCLRLEMQKDMSKYYRQGSEDCIYQMGFSSCASAPKPVLEIETNLGVLHVCECGFPILYPLLCNCRVPELWLERGLIQGKR